MVLVGDEVCVLVGDEVVLAVPGEPRPGTRAGQPAPAIPVGAPVAELRALVAGALLPPKATAKLLAALRELAARRGEPPAGDEG